MSRPGFVDREHTLLTNHGELRYTVTGTGPAVLSIQGVGVAGRGWQPQIDGLAHRFTCIAFDNCGIGRSPRGSHPLTVEGMAQDALAIADAEGLGRFHLLGHSLGGLIAQHVALTARDRVKSLALLCTFADGADATRLSARMFMLGLRTRIGTRQMRRIGMIRMVMPAAYLRDKDLSLLAQQLGDVFGRDLADQPPIVSEQLRAMSRYRATARLIELSGIPTLVLSAAHDPIAPPRLGKAMASAIAGARFEEFPDASHALPIQCASAVNTRLLEHFTQAEREA
jgi:aminoacrylate hydrolase